MYIWLSGEYIDGDDDHSRVSIDAMDVSDFDADEEDEDEEEGEGQGHNHVPKGHSRPPEPSPRPPPQPNPRSQQNASPPYSIAPKSSSRSTAHQGSPPSRSADHGPAPQHHQNMRSPPPERHHKAQTGNSYYTHRPKVNFVGINNGLKFLGSWCIAAPPPPPPSWDVVFTMSCYSVASCLLR